jgi:hypothetical protein
VATPSRALGYSHPRVLATLAEQAHTLIFQSNAVPLEVRATRRHAPDTLRGSRPRHGVSS